MNQIHFDLLTKHHAVLVKDMNPVDVVDQLISSFVLLHSHQVEIMVSIFLVKMFLFAIKLFFRANLRVLIEIASF